MKTKAGAGNTGTKLAVLYQGEAFSSQGLGKFAKDVVRIGKWVHPLNGKEVQFDSERLRKLAENTSRYLSNGNKIPFPDGHSMKTRDNMGFWPGPFIVHKDALVAVVEPTDEDAKKGIVDGSLDAVSVLIESDITDPKGQKYDEVITHVCGTNYPVLTEQGAFVELSRDSGKIGLDIYLPSDVTSVIESSGGGVETAAALERFAEAASSFRNPKSLSREDRVSAAFLELSKHGPGDSLVSGKFEE